MKSSAKGLVLTLIAMSSAAAAETFQGEGTGGYSRLDGIAHYNLQGSLYFSPVSVGDHPLREAAFLERASNIGISFTRAEEVHEDEFEFDVARVSINQFLFNSRFYLAGHLYRVEATTGNVNDSESEWGVSVGVAPVEGLLIYTNYRIAPSYTGILIGDFRAFAADPDSYEPNINAKYVMSLGDGSAYSLEGSLLNTDDRDYLFVAGDYYFNPTFSIGLWMEDLDASTNRYGMRLEKFITPGFSLTAGLGTSGNVWQVGTRLRF